MRSHQNDAAALEQWKPLIHKMAYKAARRAAAIGLPIDQKDWEQEMSITVLRCQDSFDESKGVKMITFLYKAMYNEMNKVFDREESKMTVGHKVEFEKDIDGQLVPFLDDQGNQTIDAWGHPRFKSAPKAVRIYKVSGDTTWSNGDGDESAWDGLEDDQQRSPEHAYLDEELQRWVHAQVPPETSAVLEILQSGNAFVTQQLQAYNEGVEAEAAAGGIRRQSLDMNFAFVSKLLGHSASLRAKMANQIQQAVAQYGAQ